MEGFLVRRKSECPLFYVKFSAFETTRFPGDFHRRGEYNAASAFVFYPAYFTLQMRWLSSLTPVTYFCKRQGIHCVAAFLQLELFRVIQLMII
ncbi:hypothetical protein CJP72_11700 [Citrobacter sp. NCU1]|nr:hypothetical protein [Citrobacter sp. NCU1]